MAKKETPFGGYDPQNDTTPQTVTGQGIEKPAPKPKRKPAAKKKK